MKLSYFPTCGIWDAVAPYAGAWIEILEWPWLSAEQWVAPYAGAWIEIDFDGNAATQKSVAPYAGAWIEIFGKLGGSGNSPGRSLRGSVD